MTNIKLIAVDLDNTLLRRDKTISDYTRSVFERCREHGILTAFATMRALWRAGDFPMGNYLDIIRPNGTVTIGGAFVCVGDDVIREYIIPEAIVNRVLTELSANPAVVLVGARSRDGLYTTNRESTDPSALFTDFSQPVAEPVYHFYFRSDDEHIAVSLTERFPELHIHRVSNSNLYDAGLHGADKLNGVKVIAEHFGITLNEVAAFGDDYSDVEMLRGCGYGVAMGNAIDECKQAARFECGDCDDDGVARWIKQNILREQ